MKIFIFTISDRKKPLWDAGIQDYTNRLGRYCQLRYIRIPTIKVSAGRSEREILKMEGQLLQEKIPRDSYCVVLERSGKQLDSVDLARKLRRWHSMGNKNLVFIIGGHLGISQGIIKKADYLLSLSMMTFPHKMVPLMLLEQLYRSFTILNNKKYHK